MENANDMDTNEKLMKEKRENWFQRMINIIDRHPKITAYGIFIGLIGILLAIGIAVFQYFDGRNRKEVQVNEIWVGLAPFHVNDVSNLEDKYIIMFKEPNKYLRDKKSEYRLAPYVSNSGGYEGVLKDLDEGTIKMAFISHCLYALLAHNKLCDFNWNAANDKGKHFQLLGFKKQENNRVYRSGILYNKNLDSLDIAMLDSIISSDYIGSQDVIARINSLIVILCSDEYSTSSHVFPEKYLLMKGIDLKTHLDHKSYSRFQMKELVRKNKQCIGFISNEDYERMESKDSLGFKEIMFPIPYDAVLVSTKWWDGINKTKQQEILRALNTSPLGFMSAKCERGDHKIFQEYLFSGVVNKNLVNGNFLSGSATIQIPDAALDIYGLSMLEVGDSVQLSKFIIDNRNTRFHFSLRKEEIGYAVVKSKSQNNGEHFVITGVNISTGLHVIPKTFLDKNKYSKKENGCI